MMSRRRITSVLFLPPCRKRDQIRSWVGFSVKIAHRITAGCDILLMPSRFEPCGLNQVRLLCP